MLLGEPSKDVSSVPRYQWYLNLAGRVCERQAIYIRADIELCTIENKFP